MPCPYQKGNHGGLPLQDSACGALTLILCVVCARCVPCRRDESRPYLYLVFESKGDRPVALTYFLRSLQLNCYLTSSLPWENHTPR